MPAARAAHASGDFWVARELAAEIVAGGDPPLEAVRGLGELEYLLGNYAAAEEALRRAVEQAGSDVEARVDAEVALALVYLQTNRYAESRTLFAGLEESIDLPVWELMRSFGDELPYRISWSEPEAAAPFVQETDWELPCVALEVDGLEIEARIDTGGELLTLSPDVAEALGVETVASAQGVFAAGAVANVRYGRVETVRIGPLTVEAVPVAVVQLDRPVLGTGLLRQFLSTVDYPRGRLVLRPRGAEVEAVGVEVPFALVATHLLLVRGSLDGHGPFTYLADSGLEDEGGAVMAAPRSTLDAVGIALPELTEEIGETGAGRLTRRYGRFPLRQVGLGPLLQDEVLGLYGVFPDAWTEIAGIALHGIISHGFLRRYAWTLDFDAMTMGFALPD
jgi:aspartyl protease